MNKLLHLESMTSAMLWIIR